PFFGWGKYQFNPLKSLCSISESPESSHRSFRITTFVLIACCIFIILICHIKIAQAVRRHRRRIVVERKVSQNEGPQTQDTLTEDPLQISRAGSSRVTRNPLERRGHDVHIARTVSVIVVFFRLCWGPNA
ncbi:hypothetical protein ACROYT_G019703, partial [Oculina patagonica]